MGVEDEGGVCGIVVGRGVSEIGVGDIPKCLLAALLPSTHLLPSVPTVLPADISQ